MLKRLVSLLVIMYRVRKNEKGNVCSSCLYKHTISIGCEKSIRYFYTIIRMHSVINLIFYPSIQHKRSCIIGYPCIRSTKKAPRTL